MKINQKTNKIKNNIGLKIIKFNKKINQKMLLNFTKISLSNKNQIQLIIKRKIISKIKIIKLTMIIKILRIRKAKNKICLLNFKMKKKIRIFHKFHSNNKIISQFCIHKTFLNLQIMMIIKINLIDSY